MNRQRKVAVLLLVLLLVGAHLICLVARREWWPFSHYPMYTHRVEIPISFYEIRGLPVDGEDREITIPTEVIDGPSFVRVLFGLRKEIDRANREQKDLSKVENALCEVAQLYNYHRSTGNSEIEELGGIRIYKQVWVKGDSLQAEELRGKQGKAGWVLKSKTKIAEGRCSKSISIRLQG